jgi:hypothetical protein
MSRIDRQRQEEAEAAKHDICGWVAFWLFLPFLTVVAMTFTLGDDGQDGSRWYLAIPGAVLVAQILFVKRKQVPFRTRVNIGHGLMELMWALFWLWVFGALIYYSFIED